MAEIAPGIVGVAIKAEQLSGLLAEPGTDVDSREVNPMARSVKVLSILIRELAEAFDDRDSMYPRGMKRCARLVLEDCNTLCDDLRTFVADVNDGRGGEPGKRTEVDRARMEQLQTEIDLQKAMLVATTALASFTRQVIYTSETHDSGNMINPATDEKRFEVEAAMAKAIKWDKMRILQEDMEAQGTVVAAKEANRPANAIKKASFAPTPEELRQRQQLLEEGGHTDGRQSPRSFQSNKTLQNLLAYWQELQDIPMANHPPPPPMSMPPHQDGTQQWRDEGWEDLGGDIQRYEGSRDAGTQDDRGLTRHMGTAMDHEDEAPRHWLPRSPPREASPSGVPPSMKNHHHPGALKSLMRTAPRTPSPHYDSQDERHMPPSPPYSPGSVTGDEQHNGPGVHHHHHIHHHEHHHTTHRRRRHDHDHEHDHDHDRRPPSPLMPQHEHPAVTDREYARAGGDMGDEFWNVLQANGGVHWELRKKRGDRLIVREFAGPVLDSEGETSWSHLTVSGSVWTSLLRKYCSRSVLLDLPYDFKEDEEYFHIIEELEYSQVEEIIRRSLRTMEC